MTVSNKKLGHAKKNKKHATFKDGNNLNANNPSATVKDLKDYDNIEDNAEGNESIDDTNSDNENNSDDDVDSLDGDDLKDNESSENDKDSENEKNLDDDDENIDDMDKNDSDEDEHNESNHNIFKEPSAKKKKIDNNRQKPPTNEELNELKETESIFKSNLLNLQISELLSEVKLKEKMKCDLEEWLESIKKEVMSIPTMAAINISDEIWLNKMGVKCPIKLSPPTKGFFQAMPPSDFIVMGSYAADTCLKAHVVIDVALMLPQDFLQSKDYLNFRYLRKRAFYLTYLAAHLRHSENVEELMFTYQSGNHLRPLLICKPKGNLKKKVELNFHICIDQGTLNLKRFHLRKNNVRKHWYNNEANSEKNDDDCDTPTPYYNNSIAIDLALTQHIEVIKLSLANHQNIKDGIKLLKIWLKQRNFLNGIGAFSGHISTMFVIFLLRRKTLSYMMSSYQVFRTTLAQLAYIDWTHKGISLAPDDLGGDPNRPLLEDYHQMFDIVFIDVTGYVNLCAEMNSAFYNQLKYEAKMSIEHMESNGVDGFECMFMKSIPFLLYFDQIMQLIHLEELEKVVDKFGLQEKLMDNGNNVIHAAQSKIFNLIEKALGNRINLIGVQIMDNKQWSINKLPPKIGSNDVLNFGFLLNSDEAFSLLNRGPPADLPEAKPFKEFWGEKSELRRFQDGGICEAVVWTANTIADKRKIIGRVCRYILESHAGIGKKNIAMVDCQLENVLKPNGWNHKRKNCVLYGTGEEQFQGVIKIYDELCKQLRKLDDLPLGIHSIQGSHPAFRHSAVFPPMVGLAFYDGLPAAEDRIVPTYSQSSPLFLPSLSVHCILERSGKWPDDINAVRRLKAAFYIEIGEQLKSKFSLLNMVYPTHIDVLKAGLVFRIKVGYTHEKTLLKMIKLPDGKVKISDTEESLNLEKEITHIPKLTSILHGVCQKNSSYCCAVRLCKRWISSQMMGDFIPVEAIELIVAHLYTTSAPFSSPLMPQVAFLRFLQFLSSHDWKTLPLIVNLNNQLTRLDYVEIWTSFSKHRSTIPLMFIANPDDKTSSIYTKRAPGASILQRLIILARESYTEISNQLCASYLEQDFKKIFRPSYSHYNILIHLNVDQIATRYMSIDKSNDATIYNWKKDNEQAQSKMKVFPVADYDPSTLYLNDLRDSFGDIALFFYDHCGGSTIGAIWKPDVTSNKVFKVTSTSKRKPIFSDDKQGIELALNIEAIIEDFKVLGQGVVKSIEVISSKLMSTC